MLSAGTLASRSFRFAALEIGFVTLRVWTAGSALRGEFCRSVRPALATAAGDGAAFGAEWPLGSARLPARAGPAWTIARSPVFRFLKFRFAAAVEIRFASLRFAGAAEVWFVSSSFAAAREIWFSELRLARAYKVAPRGIGTCVAWGTCTGRPFCSRARLPFAALAVKIALRAAPRREPFFLTWAKFFSAASLRFCTPGKFVSAILLRFFTAAKFAAPAALRPAFTLGF